MIQDLQVRKFSASISKEDKTRMLKDINKERDKFVKDTGKNYSEVSEGKNCFVFGYCEAGDMASKAAKEAGEYYNLRVDLSAGYIIGNNWKVCH